MNILTFSDENYEKEKIVISKLSKKYNYNHISKTKKDLIETKFYQDNKQILDNKRGAGYWLWKPYFILNEVLLLKENDYLIYTDCGDVFSNKIYNYLDNEIKNHDIILMSSFSKNTIYTKRDCFILMNCDNDKYWNSPQIEAGFSIWKKTDFSIKILNEWLKYCSILEIINDENKNENFSDFIDHRHDQSILTNLSIKYNLFNTHHLRNFIECNYKYYNFNPNSFDTSREINNFLFENKDIIYES